MKHGLQTAAGSAEFKCLLYVSSEGFVEISIFYCSVVFFFLMFFEQKTNYDIVNTFIFIRNYFVLNVTESGHSTVLTCF